MGKRNITIAFVTDDGTTISQHFGRAKYYEVIYLKDGVIAHRERREKTGHHTFSQTEHHHDHGTGKHGFDEASRDKHASMIAPITDCQMVVARGMGAGAYHHIITSNIAPIITSSRTIEEAVRQIAEGTITNHTEQLH